MLRGGRRRGCIEGCRGQEEDMKEDHQSQIDLSIHPSDSQDGGPGVRRARAIGGGCGQVESHGGEAEHLQHEGEMLVICCFQRVSKGIV